MGEWSENHVVLGDAVESVILSPGTEDLVDRIVIFKYLEQGLWSKEKPVENVYVHLLRLFPKN